MKIIQAIIAQAVSIASPKSLTWGQEPGVRDFFLAEYKQDAKAAYDYFVSTGKMNYSN